jgi:hypothetical protein
VPLSEAYGQRILESLASLQPQVARV